MSKFRYCILLLIVGISSQGLTQTGTVRGFIYDKESGEALPYVNVVLKGTTTGAATDENGFFSLSNIPTGDCLLKITFLGYDTLYEPVTVEANKIISLKLFLVQSSITLNTVTISSKTAQKTEQVNISTTIVTPKEIKRIPSFGGEPDIAQYLQVLPGVIFTGDQGGQLYIRGGSPIQTKVLLDGAVIYNPFHSIGLFSVFETDIIKNIDVYTGGFTAEYGDRVSAVLDITTRDGNKNRFTGEVSASPFLSRVLLEGPIRKIGTNKPSNATYMIAAKHSFLNQTSQSIYHYVNDGNGIPYTFTDLYGKISLSSQTGNKINFFGFNFADSVNYSSIATYHWNERGAGSNFVIVPEASNILIQGVFAYSDYYVQESEADAKPRNSSISGFNGGMDFTYFIPNGDIKYGVEVIGFHTNYDFFNRIGLQYQNQQFTTELGSFVKFRKVIHEKFIFEPSFRLQYYSSLSELSPEPRIGIKYNFNDRFRVKFAGGFYSQNLISTKSDQDVVNLFTGFLSGPEDDLYTPNGDNEATSKLQKAIHAIGGVEYDPTDFIELNIEPYIKYFTQLIEINRNKTVPQDPDFATETGKADGVDFSMKYDYKNVYIWFAYSLGFITRNDGEQVYPPHYDRRHNLNIVVSYTWHKQWEFGARWNLGSGFPFTQTAGFYENIDFFDGIGTNYTTTNGNLGIIYASQLNGGRLPYYHRLDVSAKRSFELKNADKINVTASVTNLYDRENIFYFDRVSYVRIDQLPILPSLSVSFDF